MKKLKIFDIEDLPYGTRIQLVYIIDGITNMQLATVFNTKIGLQNGKIITKRELRSWMNDNSCSVYEVEENA